jgi:hypothetical protein
VGGERGREMERQRDGVGEKGEQARAVDRAG